MKTKLEMAHEIAVAMQSQEPITDMKLLSALAWQYADAMQAEADKREQQKQDELKQGQQNQKTYDAKCSKCNFVSSFSRLDGSIHRNEINREFLCVSCPVCQSDVWVDL